jgi:hypothetical protein
VEMKRNKNNEDIRRVGTSEVRVKNKKKRKRKKKKKNK